MHYCEIVVCVDDCVIIYQSTVESFLESNDDNTLSDNISKQFTEKYGRKVNQSEFRAWDNSLMRMAGVIRSSQIPMDCGVMIEYCINPTNLRIDFVVTGHDDKGNRNFIIIELKQWSSESTCFMDGVFVVRYSNHAGESQHPSEQARSYKDYLTDMNETVYSGNVSVESCSYLHNYRPGINDPIYAEEFSEIIEDTPVFVHGDEDKLKEFLRKYVCGGKGKEILFDVENGRIRPSKKLVDYIDSLMRSNKVYTLIDKQAIAYAKILAAVRNSNKKTAIIVNGGPGTGKSVVAVNALVALARDYNVRYATPNAAFKTAIINSLDPKLRIGENRARFLFSGTSVFWDCPEDSFDVIIVDEAHRLKSKGTYMYKGESQVEDVVRSSRVSIFFVDDQQTIRPNDEGSTAYIREVVLRHGCDIKEVELTVQFRCSGAEGFINWLDHTLQIRDTANFDGWDGDFVFEIIDDPNALYTKIKGLCDKGYKARMLAGFAWNWSPSKDAEDMDVSIPECGFAMPWNSRRNSIEWAIRDDMADQIGCIHTSQGLEFDYVGVIIGNDLRYDSNTGVVYGSYDDYRDSAGKKGLKNDPEKLTLFIKQIYKVLMSRGMNGCFVYVRDSELRSYFRKRITIHSRLE